MSMKWKPASVITATEQAMLIVCGLFAQSLVYYCNIDVSNS